MLLIDWNVKDRNKKIGKLISHVVSFKPDVVCFQEFPDSDLGRLKGFNDYSVHLTNDFRYLSGKTAYICTLVRDRFAKSTELEYSQATVDSIMNKLLYEKIIKVKEFHRANYVDLDNNRKKYRIFNLHLSAAASPHTKIQYFHSVTRSFSKEGVNIICGDLNIVNNLVIRFSTGWFRGYKLSEMFMDESKEFEKILTKFNLENIFKDEYTMIFPFNIQPDHILIPKSVEVKNKYVSKKSFDSDHKMLLVEI